LIVNYFYTFVANRDFMRSTVLLLLFIASLFVCSCSTDFDINAEKKEIAIVYGLLDQNDTAQYVKITRAFLGEENALEMAVDPTLSSYGDDIVVTVTQIHNGNEVKVFNLEKRIVSNKDSGLFYSPVQEVYRFIPYPAMAVNDSFRLKVVNTVTGNIATASTCLIHDFSITKPFYNPDSPQLGLVGPSLNYSVNEAAWKTGKNGRVYEPMFRFHYREVNISTLDTTDKYVDWRLTKLTSEKLDGGEEMVLDYSTEDFYKNIGIKVPVNNNVVRIIGKVDFMVSAGGDELNTYINLNRPSTTIVQERPLYTNIANGLGIFSCRYTKKNSYNLTALSVHKLITGEYTSNLNFQ